jgi:hypothetical protein
MSGVKREKYRTILVTFLAFWLFCENLLANTCMPTEIKPLETEDLAQLQDQFWSPSSNVPQINSPSGTAPAIPTPDSSKAITPGDSFTISGFFSSNPSNPVTTPSNGNNNSQNTSNPKLISAFDANLLAGFMNSNFGEDAN